MPERHVPRPHRGTRSAVRSAAAAAAALAALLAAGCGGTGSATPSTSAVSGASSGGSSGARADGGATLIVVTGTDGNPVMAVLGSGTAPTRVTLRDGGTTASVDAVGAGWASGGREVARTKSDDDSVKLRDTSGTTLWKLRYRGDDRSRIKITKGEETEACELSQPEPGRWKAKAPDGRELGQAKKSTSRTKLEGPDGNEMASSPNDPSPAMAAIFCTDIPLVERAAVTGELIRRPA